jgi:acyl-homoserine lactone acylase PvdQ
MRGTQFPCEIYNSDHTHRYIFDPSENWKNSSWIVPCGVSGVPGSKHAGDQAAKYAKWELIPMLYEWTEIIKVDKGVAISV